MKGYGGADAVFICAGTLRGDTVYGPGATVRHSVKLKTDEYAYRKDHTG